MSDIASSDGLAVSVDNLVRDLTDWQVISYLTGASTALVFHYWFVTSSDELAFVWHRGRNLYVRILFFGARYAALAGAILYWFVVTAEMAKILTLLRIITVMCSELIFATRAWAIWERSRPILLLLIGLSVTFAALGITMAEISASDSNVLIASRFPLAPKGADQYQMTITAAKYPWAVPIPIFLIMVYQSVVLFLTLYRLLWCRRHIAKLAKSALVDVLWIDGIMYYVFMFILGVLNTGVTLKLSHRDIPLSLGQIQTALHSILSTRVVLHTATVLRQEIIDSRASLAQNQASSSSSPMRFAEVTSGTVPEDVELWETRR